MDEHQPNHNQLQQTCTSHFLLRVKQQQKPKLILDCILTNKNYFHQCIVFVYNYNKGIDLKNNLQKHFQAKAVEYVSGTYWLQQNLKKLEQGKLKILIIQSAIKRPSIKTPSAVDLIINQTVPQTVDELNYSCQNINKGVVIHLLTIRNSKIKSIPAKPEEEQILNQFSQAHKIKLTQLKPVDEKYQIKLQDCFRIKNQMEQQRTNQKNSKIITSQQEKIEDHFVQENDLLKNQYIWATYSTLKVLESMKGSKCMNYLKNSNYQSCIIYIQTETRINFIHKSLATNQIKNKISVVNGSSKLINQYLQKLESGELKALIIPKDVAIKQMKNCQIPNKVNLIISDFIPNSVEEFESMVRKSLDGQFIYKGVVLSLLNEKESAEVFTSFAVKNSLSIEIIPEKENNLEQYFNKIKYQTKQIKLQNQKQEQQKQQQQSKKLKPTDQKLIDNQEQHLIKQQNQKINENNQDAEAKEDNKSQKQQVNMNLNIQQKNQLDKNKSQQFQQLNVEKDKAHQSKLNTEQEKDKKQAVQLNSKISLIKQAEKAYIPEQNAVKEKIQQNIKKQDFSPETENKQSEQKDDSLHDDNYNQIVVQKCEKAEQTTKQMVSRAQQQKRIVIQFIEVKQKLQQNKGLLIGIQKCAHETKQLTQINNKTILSQHLNEIGKIKQENQKSTKILSDKLCELVVQIKNKGSEQISFIKQSTQNISNQIKSSQNTLQSKLEQIREHYEDSYNKLQTKIEQMSTNQDTAKENLFCKIQNGLNKSNGVIINANKLKSDETIAKLGQVERKVIAVHNSISTCIKTNTQIIAKQIEDQKISAVEDKKQMNKIIQHQKTKRKDIQNQLLSMGTILSQNQQKMELTMKQMRANQDKQKLRYNSNLNLLKGDIDKLSKSLQSLKNEKIVLQDTKLQLLKERSNVQGELSKQKKKNDQLTNQNKQLKAFRSRNEKLIEDNKIQIKNLSQINKSLKQNFQSGEKKISIITEQLVWLRKQCFDTQQLLYKFSTSRWNNGGQVSVQKNIKNTMKELATKSVTNQFFTRTAQQSLEKNKMKDFVVKMIQECKEVDSFKLLYESLLKSMNQNVEDSWKKPFAQIEYYKKFTSKLSQFKSNNQYSFKVIMKLTGQYDKLLETYSKQNKYRIEIENKIKSLNEKIVKSSKDGSICSIQKSADYNYKQSSTNQQFQIICKAVNNFNDSIKKLNKLNKQSELTISRLKEQITNFNLTIQQKQKKINSLIFGNNSLTQRINKLTIEVQNLGSKNNNLSLQKQKLETDITELINTIELKKDSIKSLESRNKELETSLSITTRSYTDEKIRSKMALQQIEKMKIIMKDNEQSTKNEKQRIINSSKIQIQTIKKQTKGQIDKTNQECLQKLKQQKSEWEDKLSDQRKTNKQQKQKMLKEMSTICQNVNHVFKNSFKIDVNMSINNYVDKLKQFQKNASEVMTKNVFLIQSQLYRRMNEQRKKFIYDSIKSLIPKKIAYTKTLFEGYPGTTWDHWLLKVGNKPNILMILRLKNGFEIAGFSQNPFSKEPSDRGRGFIMSVTNLKLYNLKRGYEGKVAKYDQYIFGMGNNELLVKNNFKFNIIISRAYCHFDTANVENKQLIGEDNDEGEFDRVEFYQMILE